MNNEYQNNHYVPVWYQKRFLPGYLNTKEIFLLDLTPKIFTDINGISRKDRELRRLGFKYCFYEKNLYTTKLGMFESTEIEKVFFGKIDLYGKNSVDYFSNFKHDSINGIAFQNLLLYLSTQKLRTPKGLDWLSKSFSNNDKNEILQLMMKYRELFCAIWSECVWLIADASESNTKFIISDHPVTVFNADCNYKSYFCLGSKDPDIRFNGTHTIFPLSLEKVLILTNLSWVRNPYQSPIKPRPNPNLMRHAMFNFEDIQILRKLSEEEVRQINLIIKKRAFRFIAAAKEDWLFPEKYVFQSWKDFGREYLLMPDPRTVNVGGQVMWGFDDGRVGSMDEYGRMPWENDFSKESNSLSEANTLQRFKGEFARKFGPYRRGRANMAFKLDDEMDDDEFHKYHLSLEEKHKNSC